MNNQKITPTLEQSKVLETVNLFSDNKELDFLIIQGSAGTGKSTIMKLIIDRLFSREITFHLSAPTGKAAKVIQSKTGRLAKTIHSMIYKPEKSKNGLGIKLVRKENLFREQSIYIIDEASMIGDVIGSSDKFLVSKPLLSDLLDYIKQGNVNNKVIFVGDKFQLPPINCQDSPALSRAYLSKNKGLNGLVVELTQVLRQEKDSYILQAATSLRTAIEQGGGRPKLSLNCLHNSTQAINMYSSLYDVCRPQRVTVVAWTNKDVNFFNSAIRNKLGLGRNILTPGDQVSFQANWMHQRRMIMKGELATILEVDSEIEEFAGLKFVNAKVQYCLNTGDYQLVETKVLLDVLLSYDGNLTALQEEKLLHEAYKRNPTIRETLNPFDDVYAGALRIRYGHAITCHKAQGGEWENVILHPWMPINDLRWQYTAVTRAAKELYTYENKYKSVA